MKWIYYRRKLKIIITNKQINQTAMSKSYEQLKELVASMESDADKFHNKGNASAGTRLRKSLQDIKTLCGTYRKEIQESKNTKA